MTMPDEYAEYESAEVEEAAPVAAPPYTPKQWSWSPNMLLWTAGGVLVAGFLVWFLMSYTSAKAHAMAVLEGASNDGAS